MRDLLRCCSRRARWARAGLVALSWLLFSAGYLLFWEDLGGEAGALAVLPAALTGLLFGWRGGLVTGVLFLPLNGVLLALTGGEFRDTLDIESLIGVLAIIVVGVVVGVVQESRSLIRRAKDDLEEARARFESLYDGVPVGIYRTSIDGRITDCNVALARMLGFENPTELVGQRAVDFYADQSQRVELIEALEATGVAEGVEVQLRSRSGNLIRARDHAHAVVDEAGETICFEGVLEDITAEKEAELAYRMSEKRFRDAFAEAPVGMAIIETDGTLLECNAALADLLGYEIEELSGIRWDAITHPDDIADNRASMSEIVQGDVDLQRVEKRYLHKDGHPIWVLVNATAVRDATAKASYLIAQIVDLTDRKRAEESLEELVRSKDEFVASVSHELRTPLTVVHGLSSELRDLWSTFSGEEVDELLSMVVDQSGEVASLVEDLLVSARSDAGTLSVRPEPIVARDEVERVISTSGSRLTARGAWEGPPVRVSADPTRFRQIIRNLLTNAQRYGGENVWITEHASRERGIVRVIDDGGGLSPEHAERIFEPYASAHSGLGQPASVGLGLTVSRTLAQLMGGDVTYRSEDGCSIFELALPLAESDVSLPSNSPMI